MATEPIKLQNKIRITNENKTGTDYQFPSTLDTPIAGSKQPVSSDFIYKLVRNLSGFIGKTVTGQIHSNNNNVVTSAAVYNAIQSISGGNPINAPEGCTLIYYNPYDGLFYDQDGNTVNLPNGLNSPTVSYNDVKQALVYATNQINTDQTTEYPE